MLPVVEDTTAVTKAFVERFRNLNPGRDPSSEVSLNHTAVHATALAMTMAGSTSDAAAIRANLDKAFKALPDVHNPHEINGVNERGGSTANTRVAVIEGGKVREIRLSDLAK